MAKRLNVAILLAVCCFGSMVTAFPNEALNQLLDNTNNSSQRAIEYKPLNCQVERYRGYRFYGNAITNTDFWTETEDICVSVCWQYKNSGGQCDSINYIANGRSCIFMTNSYGSANMDLRYDPNSNYNKVISCQMTGNPTPAPQPQPTPSGGNTGSIRPGTCGQSSVTLRNSRGLNRIVGGVEARPHSIPFIVSLRTDYNWHYCGGTLIRVSDKDESDIVVTAAHCMNGNSDSPGFNVVIGAHNADNREQGEETVAAARVVVHPKFNDPRRWQNDISVVKLARPVKFSDTIQPACLPAQNERVPDGANGIVAGWGYTRENAGVTGGPLNQVVVPIVQYNKCNQQNFGNIVDEAMICGGFDQGGKDSCQGDSGGPYFFEGKNGYTLQGVVSFGTGCARPNLPGVYARVSNYVNWIQEQVRALSEVRSG